MRYIHYFETETEFQEKRNNDYIEPWVSATKDKIITGDATKINAKKRDSEDTYVYEETKVSNISYCYSGQTVYVFASRWGDNSYTILYSLKRNPDVNDIVTIAATTSSNFIADNEFNLQVTSVDYEGEDYNRVDYNKTEDEKLLSTPLTFEITSPGNIVWKAYNGNYTRTIEYKKNDGEWTSITSAADSSAPTISVVSDDTVQFRGDNASYGYSYYYNSFNGSTCGFKVKGNIMSLINSTDFANTTTLVSAYTFRFLINGCTGLTDASNLVLPATTLADYCYQSMFYGCSSLTSAPELPATTLVERCYANMFYGCSSLTSAPELPATTLANRCYDYMFGECNNLTSAPELPATTLAEGCYTYMFYECSSLTSAPELPATTLANRCYDYMFGKCTNLTTAPSILPATTLVERCYANMFNGCSSLTTAPELPATTLVEKCYYCMFDGGCTNLNYIKCLATDISATECTKYWLVSVASSGTFIKNPSMSSWTTGYNGIPTNWTVQDA